MNSLRMMVCFAAAALLVGCGDEARELQFMPDMYQNPALRPQEEVEFLKVGSSMIVPPDGTMPRNFTKYPYAVIEGVRAGEELVNPVPLNEYTLRLGRKYYNIHCIVCHGATGAGDGLSTIASREFGMPIPPQLYTEKIRNEWKDGLLYHTITVGQGQMSGYGDRIDPEHRWAIVHYIRALGIAANPTEEDVAQSEAYLSHQQKLGKDLKDVDDPNFNRNPRDAKNFRSVFQLGVEE